MPYSPTLAIITGLFEIGAGLWVLRGPGRAPIKRPVAAILFLLAGYQLLEAVVCGGGGSLFLSRLAFADITWLPAVGALLVERLSGPKRRFSPLLLATATGLTGWILLDPTFVSRVVCKAVIATYDHPSAFYAVYGGYYQLGLFVMIVVAAFGMAAQADPIARQHLANVQVGTVGFVIPAMVTELVVGGTEGSQPSLMCHYAVVLAVMLVRLAAREQRQAGGTPTGTLRPQAA